MTTPKNKNAKADKIVKSAKKNVLQMVQPSLNDAPIVDREVKRHNAIVEPYLKDIDKFTSISKKAQAALNVARKLQSRHATWVEANNALYGVGGVLTQLFPNAGDRTEFVKTDESAEIQAILESLPEPKAQVGKPRSEVNGKILVRVPKSIHAALLGEAQAEGVSLNQLIVSKLSVQLRAAV